MKTSELIAQLQQSLKDNGDLVVLSEDGYSFLESCVSVEDAEDWPNDWDMPEQFIMLKDYR